MASSISLLQQVRSSIFKVIRFATLVAAFTGCQGERSVAIRVSIPNADSVETPAAGVGVIALPYNRDSVLASLEEKARTPRPHTTALDSLFARFRGPFTAYTRISYTTAALQDSLEKARKALEATPADSPGRRSLTGRIRQLTDSLGALEAQAERARRQLTRARAEFVQQSETLRAAVRHWEDSTYRGYDSLVEQLVRFSGREAATDTTGETGWANFRLAPGDWWLYARAWDTSDPNAEWYWNVPVNDDTVFLSSRTGRRRPRY